MNRTSIFGSWPYWWRPSPSRPRINWTLIQVEIQSNPTIIQRKMMYPDSDFIMAGRPSLFSLLLYMQCLLWVSASVFDVYAGMRHRRSRLRGYLEFERRVRPLVRAVPASVTGGSVRPRQGERKRYLTRWPNLMKGENWAA